MRICCGGSSPFLWTVQGDAAAELEDDDERCGGSGARATEGLRERKKTMEKGENEERPFVPIYKEKADKWARKTRRPKHGYPATQAPRFSERH